MEKIIKLTKNEQKVLKYLSNEGRITDSEIAKYMKLTVSSVSRIREKLVDKKLINGYYASVNYDKLGINCYVLTFYSATPKWWSELKDKDIKKIMNAPQIISCIRTNETDFSYIVTYGFPDNRAANTYFNEVQQTYNNYLKIEKLIYLSAENFIKNNNKDLLDISFSKDASLKPNYKLFSNLLSKNVE